MLRIKALLRRARIVDEHRITIGDVELDYDTHTVRRGHDAQVLPPKEFNLLYSCWLTRKGPLPGWNCWMRSGVWTAKVTIKR